MVFNGKTNPFIFPLSWPMEAVQAAVRRDIRGYKKLFNALPSLLWLCNPLSLRDWFELADSPSLGSLRPHGHFIEIQIDFTIPFFFNPHHFCQGWQHHGRICLSTLFCPFLKRAGWCGSGLGEPTSPPGQAAAASKPPATGPTAPALDIGKQGPLSFRALVCSGGRCTILFHRSTSAGVEPGKLGSTCPFERETVVLEEKAIFHRFSCSALILSFTQVALSTYAPAHIPSLPFSFFFSHGRFRKFNITPSDWARTPPSGPWWAGTMQEETGSDLCSQEARLLEETGIHRGKSLSLKVNSCIIITKYE